MEMFKRVIPLCGQHLLPQLKIFSTIIPLRSYSLLTSSRIMKPQLLAPTVTAVTVPSCGVKVMGHVKRRCKDCFLVMRDNRLYNYCKTHPRHKQMSMIPHERKDWILTYACQSPRRPW